jgi:hypothetical protein
MWFMVEYGLRVPITQRIRDQAQGILKRLLNKIQRKDEESGDKTASPKTENTGKSAGEAHSKLEPKVSLDRSSPEDGSKKQQARRRKWFPKREKSKPDEEKGAREYEK